jgi:hypothetical protein
MDPYTLGYLAGHGDFSTARRYVRPQAHTIMHKHDCCKNMVSLQMASVLPNPHVPLSIPVAVPAGPLPVTEIVRSPEIFWPKIDAPQHAPPDLYLVYASLLI